MSSIFDALVAPDLEPYLRLYRLWNSDLNYDNSVYFIDMEAAENYFKNNLDKYNQFEGLQLRVDKEKQVYRLSDIPLSDNLRVIRSQLEK